MSPFSSRFRFSLRTLFFMVLATSLVGAWVGIQARRVVLQRDAVKKIQELGGTVTYGEANYVRWFGYEGRGSSWGRTTFPNWVSHVERVRIYSREFDDKDMKILAQLPAMRTLGLYGTKITDESLGLISRFDRLQRVMLVETRVTEQGVRALAENQPNLIVLHEDVYNAD